MFFSVVEKYPITDYTEKKYFQHYFNVYLKISDQITNDRRGCFWMSEECRLNLTRKLNRIQGSVYSIPKDSGVKAH